MKRYILIAISLLFLSCEKEQNLDGTIWIRSDNVVRLEFNDNSCFWIRNPGNMISELSVWCNYDYNHPNISILLPSSTGFPVYKETVTKTEMTLIPQWVVSG